MNQYRQRAEVQLQRAPRWAITNKGRPDLSAGLYRTKREAIEAAPNLFSDLALCDVCRVWVAVERPKRGAA